MTPRSAASSQVAEAVEPAPLRADTAALVVDATVAAPEPDLGAARILFERHHARVLAYCRRRLGSREEAEDALQTTFFYACRGLQRGVVPTTEVAWLLKIAHNVCLNQLDARRRRSWIELARDPGAIDRSAAAPASGQEELVALEHALADLTDLQRQAILLREWRGLSYHEIAAELGLTTAAVETLIFRARRALAQSLERQDVRGRLLRGFDIGSLLAGLKSLFGTGGAAKIAACVAVGATVAVSGSVPDRAPAPPAEPARAAEVRSGLEERMTPSAPPAAVDRAVASTAKARASKRKDAPGGKSRPGKTKRKGGQPPASPGPAGGAGGSVGETASGAVGTVTSTVGGVVGTATGAVEGTVGTVTGTVGTVTGTVGTVTGTLGSTAETATGTVGGVVETATGSLPLGGG